MKLVRRFPEAPRLVEKLNDGAASTDTRATKGALSAALLDSAFVSSAYKYCIVLYIEDAAAQTQGLKQSAGFNGSAIYSYASSLFQALRSMHSTTPEKLVLSFEIFLGNKIPQTKNSPLPARKMYWNKMIFFSCDRVSRKRSLTARFKGSAQQVVRLVTKHCSPREVADPTAGEGRQSSPPSTPRDFRRLTKRVSHGPSRLYLGLALRTP